MRQTAALTYLELHSFQKARINMVNASGSGNFFFPDAGSSVMS